MSNRSGAIAIIICTLVIGIAIGALVVGPTIAKRHFEHFADVRTPEGFVAMLERTIEPDPGQAEAVHGILMRYGERLDEISERHRAETKAMFDSMRAELGTVLTEEQQERLERQRHHPGPPPHRPD
jgi:hypothetical protein